MDLIYWTFWNLCQNACEQIGSIYLDDGKCRKGFKGDFILF